jgi:hypothetical protein
MKAKSYYISQDKSTIIQFKCIDIALVKCDTVHNIEDMACVDITFSSGRQFRITRDCAKYYNECELFYDAYVAWLQEAE